MQETTQTWQGSIYPHSHRNLQGNSTDLLLASSKRKAFTASLETLRQDNPELPTELSKFIVPVAAAAVEDEPELPTFRGVRLNKSHQGSVLDAFSRFTATCISSLKHCVADRFRDLERNDTLKGAALLDMKSSPAGDDLD